MTKTVFLVKQTQPVYENCDQRTFAVFDTEKEAEKCCKWHNKEYGNDVDPDDDYDNCHFYEVEEIEVETKFKS